MADASNNVRELADRALELLDPEDNRARRQAYEMLRVDAKAIAAAFIEDDWVTLLEAVANEREPDLARKAAAAMDALLVYRTLTATGPTWSDSRAATGEKSQENAAAYLGGWLWRDFAEKSALFQAIDPDHFRRDENTVIALSYFYGKRSFSEPHIVACSTAEESAHNTLVVPNCLAFCVVGRPGLLGDIFLEGISLSPRIIEGQERPATRFHFTIHRRPPNSPRINPDGARPLVDPNYSFLVEQLGDGTSRRYETKETQYQREDWGLVQRYQVEISGQRRTIVIIAGASSLGTLGAAKWATRAAEEIPLGKDADDCHCMEALIRATADTGRPVWEPINFDLVYLSVDRQKWDTKQRKWSLAPPDEVTLVVTSDRPTAILLDREPCGMKKDSQNFALACLLAESKLAGEAEVLLDDLQKNQTLSGGNVLTREALNNMLNLLRNRYLGATLRITSDAASLECKVRRLDSDLRAIA